MKFKIVIFDLDGTLADSFPWFLENLNSIAVHFDIRPVGMDEVEKFRHKNTLDIIKAMKVPMWKIPMISTHFRKLKGENIHKIDLFFGINEMIEELAKNGIKLALVSSDSEENVKSHLGEELISHFSYIACGTSLFGKADKFRKVIKHFKAKTNEIIAIGDEIRDIEAAREAKITCGAVSWGYAHEDALLAHKPDYFFKEVIEVTKLILS